MLFQLTSKFRRWFDTTRRVTVTLFSTNDTIRPESIVASVPDARAEADVRDVFSPETRVFREIINNGNVGTRRRLIAHISGH